MTSAHDDDRSESRKPALGSHVELAGEQIHWDLGESLSYGQYLHLDKVLGAQNPLSGQHDEMLFIVMHQASELWMKLCVHELQAAVQQIRGDDLGPAFKMLARVSRVQQQLAQSWDVLSTMTPADYSAFRDSLGKSSGFQSYQYRTLEYLIGNKNAAMIEVHRRSPEIYEQLRGALHSPSLYDESLRLLGRRGFAIPASHLERDWSEPYREHAGVTAAWLEVYRNTDEYWDLYELAEKLVDLDQRFQLWRFAHLKTVERIIGYKRGTGGSSGVSYLSKAMELRFFPELWSVRTSM
jgi:tryptophan 2,3-dioxygenase